LRPVAAGWCKYESLLDGTIGLLDIGLMNDAIQCQIENDRIRIERERVNRSG